MLKTLKDVDDNQQQQDKIRVRYTNDIFFKKRLIVNITKKKKALCSESEIFRVSTLGRFEMT